MKFALNFLFKRRYQLLGVLFAFQLLYIMFAQRGILLKQYDALYWKDRFEHSQWQLPLSHRTIGDDGLFEYIGYTLVHGADPSLVNAETPPVGKYLLGVSIVLFGSPLVYTFAIGLATLVVFFFLCKRFLKNTIVCALCSLALLFDPLFFSQLTGGWVDTTQLFFLLSHFFLLFSIPEKKGWLRYIFIILSALCLGFFAESKTPIFLPVILIVDILYLYRYSFGAIGIFTGAFFIGDLLPYAYYFFLHHSLGDFIRLQKYIISFYAKSRLKVHHDALWTTVLFGKFPDIVSGIWGNVKEWWIVWPVAFAFGLFQIIRMLVTKRMTNEARVIVVFVLFAIGVFSIIPFYPRYLLIMMPFIYLFAFSFFAKFKKNIFWIILIAIVSVYGFINTYIYLQQNPQDIVNAFSYNLSHGYFQDIYQEDISAKSKIQTGMDRVQFFRTTHTAFTEAEIRSVAVKLLSVDASFMTTSLSMPLSVTYYTQNLGTFTQTKQLHLVKEHGQWKVVWDWNLVVDKFVPGDTLVTTIIPGKRGSIIDKKGNVLAQDDDGFLVSVIPAKIDIKREQDMLQLFQKLAGKKAVHLQDAYLENALPSEAVPVFTNFVSLSTQDEQQLAYFPGVSFSPTIVRLYQGYPMNSVENTKYSECCSRIYSSWSYHGIAGFEKQYDKVLSGYDGGSLQLLDNKGHTINTFIQKEPKNGQDVSVSL